MKCQDRIEYKRDLRSILMAKPLFDFSHLTPDERVQLADELWESISDQPEALPLTAAQVAELDRRLDSYRKDRDPGQPWREVLDEIEKGRV
jgi:putative addiction module component (TIGR02574 family)